MKPNSTFWSNICDIDWQKTVLRGTPLTPPKSIHTQACHQYSHSELPALKETLNKRKAAKSVNMHEAYYVPSIY